MIKRNMYFAARVLAVPAICFALAGCGKQESENQHRKEANTVAGKVGQAAYGAAKVTSKVAQAAGRELGKAAHEAHEGWKDASQKDKAKRN